MTKADDHEREMAAALVCFHSLLEGGGARSSKLASIRTCPCQVDYAMRLYRTKYIFMSICSIFTALDNFTITILKETEAEMIFLATKQC